MCELSGATNRFCTSSVYSELQRVAEDGQTDEMRSE